MKTLRRMLFIRHLLCLFILYLSSAVSEEKHRICAVQTNNEACQQLARNLKLACNDYLHNVDCLLGIESKKAHIGRISGEDAFLGANLVSDNVVVLGEVRGHYATPETVVIVKSEIPDGFINLKGKQFCHPGYKHDGSFSYLILQELENKIIALNESFCADDNLTLLEKHIQSLKHFFGESCRPGPWTQDDDFDKILKEKYDSLCTLCGENKCQVDYKTPFNSSLKCLIEKNGDVAVSTLSEAYKFFNRSNKYASEYKYLCKDGSSRSSSAPCTWSSQLPSLIVTERSVARQIREYLQTNLGSKIHNLVKSGQVSVSDEVVEEALTTILKLTRLQISLFDDSNYQSLKDYVNERRPIPTFQNSTQCDRTLKWCTYSDFEQEKCKWLSQAGMNWGIKPVVECKQTSGKDELSCLDDIKKKYADIVVASSDYAYISLNKGLQSVAYPETYTTTVPEILVVKKANDNSIKTFADMKEKGICLPRYGGKEHLAFIDTLRRLDVLNIEKCDYGKLLNDLVGPSCTPGVRSSLIRESTEYVDQDKLCDTCRQIDLTSTSAYCNDDNVNKYFGSDGALRCLNDGAGKFAVITRNDTSDGFKYRAICKNNTVSSRVGLDVDDECLLNKVASSEVVSEVDNPKNPDIILALHEFEKWFGSDLQKSFHLFNKFNETVDLLFKDSTPGLSFNDNLYYLQNYKKLLQNVKNCKEATVNAADMTTMSFFIFVIAFIANMI